MSFNSLFFLLRQFKNALSEVSLKDIQVAAHVLHNCAHTNKHFPLSFDVFYRTIKVEVYDWDRDGRQWNVIYEIFLMSCPLSMSFSFSSSINYISITFTTPHSQSLTLKLLLIFSLTDYQIPSVHPWLLQPLLLYLYLSGLYRLYLNEQRLMQFLSLFCSHDFIGEFTTSYKELCRGQSQLNVYEVSGTVNTFITLSIFPQSRGSLFKTATVVAHLIRTNS